MLYTLDSNAVAAYLRDDREFANRFERALLDGHDVALNAISYFEVKRGLDLPRYRRHLKTFMCLTRAQGVLPLELNAIDIAADIFQSLRRSGLTLEDADVLMAGIALANDAALVTRNVRHFARIEGLKLEAREADV